MKKIVIILVVLALGGAAYWHFFGGKKGGAEGAPQGGMPSPEVSFITTEAEEAPITIELPGRVAASKIAEIRPQVSGILTKRLFEEGALVEKGKQLYQINPAPYEAELARADAALKQAEANIAALRSRQQRFDQLLQIGGVSRQEADDAKAALAQGEAAVAVAQAAVQSARINVGFTRITAPITGRIGRSEVTEGALVSAGQPTALAIVTQLDPIYVDMTQSSAEMLKLRERFGERGNDGKIPVTLHLEGQANPYPSTGTLEFSEVTVDQGTGMVTLRAQFSNEHNVLLPGMFVRATLEESRITNAILVPQSAVNRTPDGGAMVMIVGDDDKIQPRPVKTGEAFGDKWLITEGLSGGERVVVSGAMKAPPGTPVKAVPFGAAPAPQQQEAPPEPAEEPAKADDAAKTE